MSGFATYNFDLQPGTQFDQALLTLTGGTGNEQTRIVGSSINVNMQGAAAGLQAGDRVILMQNTNGITVDNNTTYGTVIKQGVSVEYDVVTGLDQEKKKVVSEVVQGRANEQSKSPVETRTATAAFLNEAADFVHSALMDSATAVTRGSDKFEIYGSVGGTKMRQDSGSYADIQGYNLALGAGKTIANNAGKLVFGPFVEYGNGSYDSYLDNGIHGEGDTKYVGVGMLARQDNHSGLYYEGSLRYGRLDADYASDDMAGALGKIHSSYDSSSAYYGAHLGIGKITKLNDTDKADVYAKLMYTHQGGDSVTLQGAGNGETYDFDSMDSVRARVGGRLSKDFNERGTGYVGLAYEYEFDGEARATVQGFDTASPSIKGGSGMLELGYVLQAKTANDPSVNISLQGWEGKKRGGRANVNFIWKF